jgi:peptidoglycan hydrolase FlgJ
MSTAASQFSAPRLHATAATPNVMRDLAARSAPSASNDPSTRAREQAVDFEAMVLNNMFSQMFTGIEGDGPFGGAGATGVWRSFLTDEYAKSFARSGGIGIADHVYRSLLTQQEARSSVQPHP